MVGGAGGATQDHFPRIPAGPGAILARMTGRDQGGDRPGDFFVAVLMGAFQNTEMV